MERSDDTTAEPLAELREDPLANLHPTARKLIDAALTLLRADGYEGLTLSAIALESGEHKASVSYYFGNKGGLISALVRYLLWRSTLPSRAGANGALPSWDEIAMLPSQDRRIRNVVEVHRGLSVDTSSFRLLLDIFPHAARLPELREQVAEYYQLWRSMNTYVLAGEDGRTDRQLRGFGTLMLAVLDGLCTQEVFGLDTGELDVAWDLWTETLTAAANAMAAGVD